MSGKAGYWLAVGRVVLVLTAGWLARDDLARAQLPGPANPPGPAVLARPVALRPGNRSLGEILAELSRQSRLPFSYSSSLIPMGHRYSLPAGPPRPLGEVLREVMAASHLSYGLLDGQLVLWPDHTALPAGVTAVNGRPTRSAPPLAGRVAFAAKGPAHAAAALARPRAARKSAPQALTTRPPARASSPPATLAATPAPRQMTSTTAVTAGASSAFRPARPEATPPAARTWPAGRGSYSFHLSPAAQTTGQAAAARGRAASQSLGAITLPGAQYASGSKRKSLAEPLDRKIADQAATATLLRRAGNEETRSWALLTPRIIALAGNTMIEIPTPSLLITTKLGLEGATQSAPTLKKRLDLANAWNHTYLHGEVWLSETLPVGGTVKIGVPHAYLVLNAAIGPLDRRSGVAWGAGFGTAGRARGRFTPSLDAVAWFLSNDGDDGIRQARLLQLRPLLAWQVKRDGQVSLLAGPTLNLATADHNGNRQWSFGQDQWPWLNTADEQSIIRLWPGVQVGLRF